MYGGGVLRVHSLYACSTSVETRRFTNSRGRTMVLVPRGFSLEIEFHVAVRCYLLVYSGSRLVSMSRSYVEIHKFQLFLRDLRYATNYNIFAFFHELIAYFDESQVKVKLIHSATIKQ